MSFKRKKSLDEFGTRDQDQDHIENSDPDPNKMTRIRIREPGWKRKYLLKPQNKHDPNIF